MPAVAAPRLPAVAGARESLPIDLADQVIEIVAPTRPFAASNSPDLELLAARASSPTGTRVEANDFPAAADSLPDLLAPLQPLLTPPKDET